LGIPQDAQVESHSLQTLLQNMHAYNSQRASALVASTPTNPSQATQEYTRNLAAQALWTAIAAKLGAESASSPNSSPFKQFPMEASEIASLEAAGKLDYEDPAMLAAVILRRYLPSLEHNEFSWLFPSARSMGIPSILSSVMVTPNDVEAARKLLPPGEGDEPSSPGSMSFMLGLHFEDQDDHKRGSSPEKPTPKAASSEKGAESDIQEARKEAAAPDTPEGEKDVPLGKGLILVGDLDLPKNKRQVQPLVLCLHIVMVPSRARKGSFQMMNIYLSAAGLLEGFF